MNILQKLIEAINQEIEENEQSYLDDYASDYDIGYKHGLNFVVDTIIRITNEK